MSFIFNSVKDDIIKNGIINWPGILFTISEPIAFVSIFIALKHSFESIVNPKLFSVSNLHISFFLALAFMLKIRYMWNKPLARILVLCNSVGWLVVTILYSMAYKKYIFYDKKK